MESKKTRENGSLIQNRYRIMGVESVGALAVIYDAFDQVTSEPVVITAVRKGKTDIQNSRYPLQRLYKDAAFSAKVTHPDILHAYDQFEDADSLFLVSEFAGFSRLTEFTPNMPRPDFVEVLRAMQKVVYAVEFYHSNRIFGCCIAPRHVRLSFGGELKIDDFIACRMTYLSEHGDAIARTVLERPDVAERIDMRLAGTVLAEMLRLLPDRPSTDRTDRYAGRMEAMLRLIMPVLKPMPDQLLLDFQDGGFKNISAVSEIMRTLDDKLRVVLSESGPNFSASSKRRQFSAGEVIFREGDGGNEEAFIIERGVVQISKRGPEGRDIYLDVSKAGDIVGEMALIDRQPRMATARALEPTTLVVISGTQIRQNIEQMNSVNRRLVTVLANRLRFQAKEVARLKALIGIKR